MMTIFRKNNDMLFSAEKKGARTWLRFVLGVIHSRKELNAQFCQSEGENGGNSLGKSDPVLTYL